MTTLRIVQLHHDLLGVTGDRGNVDVLVARARAAGHEAVVERIGLGEPSPADADIVVIGNGPLSAMRAVRDDLSTRRDWLSARLAAGASVLAVGGGAELLTHGVALLDGSRIDGLGLVPVVVTRTRARRVGYIIADTADGRLIGFEDHASQWELDPDADPGIRYGKVVVGKGGLADGFETIAFDGVWATNVQGPVLPLNPQLADAILRRALARSGAAYEQAGGHETFDIHARAARADIERLAESKQFSTITL